MNESKDRWVPTDRGNGKLIESITRPTWFTPERNGVERGRLLYLEEWARKKRFKDRSYLIIGPCLVVVGIVLGSLSAFASIDTGNPVPGVMLGLIAIVVAGMGYVMFRDAVQEMPFAIYERGFTLTSVSFEQGWKRQETFVPWERLDSVRLEESSLYNVATRLMRLHYDGKEEQSLGSGNLSDPFAAMRLFKRFVPNKMNRAFSLYLGEDEERRIMTNPLPDKGKGRGWIFPLGLFELFFIMVSGLFFPLLAGGKYFVLLPIGLISPLLILLFTEIFKSDRSDQRSLMENKAGFGPQGISFPQTFFGKYMKDVRNSFPWSEIRAVRMKLNSLFYYHEAEIETTGGERFKVPFSIYQRMGEREDFQKAEWDYFNTDPAASSGPLERRNIRRLAVFTVLLVLPGLAAALVSASADTGFIGQVAPYLKRAFLTLIFAFFLPLYIFLKWKMAQRSRFGRDIFASDKGIMIPNAPSKFQNVLPGDFISARVEKDLYGPFCELNTTKGSLKLPQASAEALVHAGYPVENASDLGALPIDGYLGEGAPVPPARDEANLPEGLEPGKLLLEEPLESLASKKKKTSKLGYLISGLGMLLMLALLGPIGSGMIGREIVVVLGIVIIGLGIYLARVTSRLKAVRIHQNGVFFPDIALPNGEIFIPYGRIRNISEETLPIYGKGVNFHIDEQLKYFILKSMPGFSELLDDIRDKVGQPEYDCRSFSYPYNRIMSLTEKIMYAIVFPIGFGLMYLWVATLKDSGEPVHWARTLLYGAPLSLLFISYLAYKLEFTDKLLKKRGKDTHIDERLFASLVIIAVVLFAIGLPFSENRATETQIFKDDPPLGYERSGSIANESLELNGSILVADGTILNITDSQIIFNMSENGGSSIYVAQDGILNMNNTTVRSSSGQYGYRFEIYGAAILENSTFTGLFAHESLINGDGGIEIFSNQVRLANCTIENNLGNGIMVFGASPVITDCTFRGNKDDAIELHQSNALITDNTIQNNGWGIVIFSQSAPRIEGNYIENNEYGIYVENSKPMLKHNIFKNNTKYAIVVAPGINVEHTANTFAANGEDYYKIKSLDYYLSVCSTIFFIIGIVAGLKVYVKVRKRKAELLLGDA